MSDNENGKELMTVDTQGEIVVAEQPRELTPAKWAMIERIAKVAYKARIFSKATNFEMAAMTILKGFELGFGITAGLEFIQPIQGKVELIPRGALALLHGHPGVAKIEINRLVDDEGAFLGMECTIERTNGFSHTSSFTMEDAKRAGLVKPDSGYVKYPENMCMWRAIGFAADVAAPDITSGMTAILKMPEHYGVELDQQGNLVDTEVVEVQPLEINPVLPIEQQQVSVQDLINAHGAKEVMDAIQEANGGRMPGSDEEIQRVQSYLVNG